MRGNFRYVARCFRGHLFDEANARITKKGWQECRECDRDRKRIVAAAARSIAHIKETATE